MLHHPKGLHLFVFLVMLLCAPTTYAIVEVGNTGDWPESWPKELEPLRKDARTFRVSTALHEDIYEIRFKDRDVFERSWPLLMVLKSKGAPLTLYNVESEGLKQKGLFSNETPAVRIYFSVRGAFAEGLASGPPWPSSAMMPDGRLSEYVIMRDIDGKKTWIPATPGNDFRGLLFRARIDMALVIDGKIIDLNRIRIPSDTPITDKRWPGLESGNEPSR